MKKSGIVLFLTIITVIAVAQQKQTIFDNAVFEVEPAQFINTVGSDISPLFINDSLYFSAIREDYFNKNNREKKNKAFYDVYSAALIGDSILTSERVLVPGFGYDLHEGPACFCEASGELFVTMSNVIYPDTIRKIFSEEKIRLRLVIMKKTNNKWQITEEFPFNNDKYNLAHPAVTVTGDTLVFSGDMDSESVSNSDLYMSVREGGVWSLPVNLGKAVNTPGKEMFPTFIGGGILAFSSNTRKGGLGGFDIWFTDFPAFSYVKNAGDIINTQMDEFGLVINKDGNTGYFSSNRDGAGSDDIFRLKIKKLYSVFNGKVRDDQTNLPIANAKIDLRGCDGNIVTSIFSDGEGNFSFEILHSDCPKVEASKNGYENDSRDITGLSYIELRLRQKKVYEIITLDVETKLPVPGAEMASGDGKKWINNTTGIFAALPEFAAGSRLVVRRDGYLDQSLIIDETRLAKIFHRDTVWLYKKELNKTFVLDNIYYDYDKWDILPESEIELNKLINIMNDNLDLKVELGSHTDARGSDLYNELLSQKRSDSAVGYIIAKGIHKTRIIAKGYGEKQLINHCKNGVKCSDEDHRKNRRTEFKIIGF